MLVSVHLYKQFKDTETRAYRYAHSNEQQRSHVVVPSVDRIVVKCLGAAGEERRQEGEDLRNRSHLNDLVGLTLDTKIKIKFASFYEASFRLSI